MTQRVLNAIMIRIIMFQMRVLMAIITPLGEALDRRLAAAKEQNRT
jgi:hypothetical protein